MWATVLVVLAIGVLWLVKVTAGYFADRGQGMARRVQHGNRTLYRKHRQYRQRGVDPRQVQHRYR